MSIWHKLKILTYLQFQLIFSTIHESHYTFWYYSWVTLYYSANFYIYLQYFQQKVFNFS